MSGFDWRRTLILFCISRGVSASSSLWLSKNVYSHIKHQIYNSKGKNLSHTTLSNSCKCRIQSTCPIYFVSTCSEKIDTTNSGQVNKQWIYQNRLHNFSIKQSRRNLVQYSIPLHHNLKLVQWHSKNWTIRSTVRNA